MEKEFVPYELAVKLKELGFDEDCFGFYNTSFSVEKVIIYNDVYGGYGIGEDHIVLAPTFSQAFRWFRENYCLHGANRKRNENGNIYFEQIFDEDVLQNGPYNSYEEAEIACLDKLIEIIESKEK